ncbi:lupus La protein [Ascaphus truei]|uniref:lupus La protein n=1 Tax=Ascaphus truei TaxID=8439 RepID=UPI003F59F6F5
MAENGKDQMSDLETQICQQIEYYFGDHNLLRDTFLKEQISLDDDGWVPLETMIKFNRLKKLTTDLSVIMGALKKSNTDLLELNEDNGKIRRSSEKPLPEVTDEYKNSVKSRSIYIKGFPDDTTLDDIKAWLDKRGPVENIQMRKSAKKVFKGSIFLIFDTDDSAKKFLENTDRKYKDSDMIILSKDDYLMKKKEERKHTKLEAKAKTKQDKEENQKQAEDSEMKSLDEKTGCLLKFSGALDDKTSREDIHALFQSHGDIKWIDFSRGAKEGIILFKVNAKEALEKAKAANNGNLQLKDHDVKWELLEGDEEKQALKKLMEDQQESLNRRKGKGRQFKGKGRGGKGNESSPKKKIQFQGKKTKFESSDEDGDMEDTESPKKETGPRKESKSVQQNKNGAEASGSPKKRVLEEKSNEEPASKQLKTENGAGDQ